jgi:hypothetical protein
MLASSSSRIRPVLILNNTYLILVPSRQHLRLPPFQILGFCPHSLLPHPLTVASIRLIGRSAPWQPPGPHLATPAHPGVDCADSSPVGRQGTLAPRIRLSGEMPVGPPAAATYGEQG